MTRRRRTPEQIVRKLRTHAACDCALLVRFHTPWSSWGASGTAARSITVTFTLMHTS